MALALRDAAAGAKHARLHGPGRNSNDLRDLCHQFLVVINEVDDFSLRRGKPRQAFGLDRPGATTMALSVPSANSDVEDENGEAKIIIEMVKAPKRDD